MRAFPRLDAATEINKNINENRARNVTGLAAGMDEANKQGKMCETSRLVEQLTSDEKACLRQIGRGGNPDSLSMSAISRLIRLGLAMVEMGTLNLTGTGRRALGMI